MYFWPFDQRRGHQDYIEKIEKLNWEKKNHSSLNLANLIFLKYQAL